MSDQTPFDTAIRVDRWTPERQMRFLDHLAAGGNVSAASARVGMRREEAYRLRRRDALFARAWDVALVLAREVSAEVLADRALDGIEEDVWYKGELVGTRRKYDSRLLLAHMARLDRIADELQAVSGDAARFDELLAAVAGEAVPQAIAIDGPLPPTREEAIAIATEAAADAWDQEPDARAGEDRPAAMARAAAEAALCWDEWIARAYGAVERVLEGSSAAATDSLDPVTSVASVSPASGA